MNLHEFDTPRAMRVMQLREPAASRVLAELCAAKMISFVGTSEDFCDSWRVMSAGLRIGAARIGKRFSLEEGEAIALQAVEKARVLNSEVLACNRITRILLFGSVAVPNEQRDAGDVDLAIDTQFRNFRDPDLEVACKKAEYEKAPASLDYIQKLDWRSHRLKRAIKRVSNKISIHSSCDVEMIGAPHRVIYDLDISTERERELSGELICLPKVPSELDLPEAAWRPATSKACVNPPLISDRMLLSREAHSELGFDQRLDRDLDLAEHRWANGAPVEFVLGNSTFSKRAAHHIWGGLDVPKDMRRKIEEQLVAM